MTSTSKEYAQALFLLSEETNTTEEVAQALTTVQAIFEAHPAYVELLTCPGVPKAERLAAVGAAFATLPDTVVSFVQLLCERGHIRELAQCITDFRALHLAAKQVAAATVRSAITLTETEKEALTRALAAKIGKTVTVTWIHDPSLLGGVIVEVDGKVLDGSLRHRLQEVKEVMDT